MGRFTLNHNQNNHKIENDQTFCYFSFVKNATSQLNFGSGQSSSTSRGFRTSPQPATEVFTHTINRKFFNFNKCCKNSLRYCERPCAGKPCDAGCRVQCGVFGQLCQAVSCAAANPGGCSGSVTTTPTTPSTTSTTAPPLSSCDAGYTLTGSKCLKLVTTPSNYLQAILGCVNMGATLVSMESQADQDAVFALTGSTGGWIGLTDFLDEGVFSWVDGAPVSYTNWRFNAPNNNNNNQHCTQVRANDGEWDDVICNKNQQYVCQKNARP